MTDTEGSGTASTWTSTCFHDPFSPVSITSTVMVIG
jgi:hypothetical protein